MKHLYIVIKSKLDTHNTVLETSDKAEVIKYLRYLDVRERDTTYVNGTVGGEWLFDNHVNSGIG